MNQQTLAQALCDAEKAHAIYERVTLNGVRDVDWANWYAHYILVHLSESKG